jgi:predicted dehydrogenase
MGSAHLKNIVENQVENAVVTAVADLKKDRLEKVKQDYPNAEIAYFENGNDLIDNGAVDAVVIATPHYSHPPLTIRALQKGIHVLCEKPAGVYTKQVKEMNEVAEKSNALFGMMFNQRTNCLYRKMREIVVGGGIGEVKRVNWIITDWYRTQAYYDGGSWRATWAGEGGGVLINQCPHQIDLVQWVLGQMPKKVHGFCHYGKWHDIEVEDDVTAYFEYENGATGVFITTTGEAPGTNRFEVSGSKGKLICERDELIWYKNERDNIEVCKTSDKGFDTPKCERIVVETDGKNPQHAGIINNLQIRCLAWKKCSCKVLRVLTA